MKSLVDRFAGRVRCPWCRGTNLKLASLFGGTVSELLFECQDCHLPVGVMKWDMLDPACSSSAAQAANPDTGNARCPQLPTI